MSDLSQLLQQLAERTSELESEDAWPAEQFKLLAESGVLGWVIPKQFGGSEISGEELIDGYLQLSKACLVTAFVLTQRNGACQRIANSENEQARETLLPRLCAGELFATVGISHLTTSRQHLAKPAVQVSETDRGFVFNGLVPWVTGAKFADLIVTGGTLDDGRQVLAAIDTTLPGITIADAAKLMALNASQTGFVTLNDAEVPREALLFGPVEEVMKQGPAGGTGSLTTSALALGSALNSIEQIGIESEKRPDLVAIYDSLNAEHQAIRNDMDNSGIEGSPHNAESIRQRSNSLVLRASQAYLAASKGAGFVVGHAAGRAVRESMFFLVWSCPQSVLNAALREFACMID